MFNDLNDLFNIANGVYGKDVRNMKGQIALDIYDEQNGYQVLADLPGVLKEDIKLSYINDVFKVEVHSKKDEKKEKYQLIERTNEYMPRSIYLKNVDFSASKAKLENGVLKVFLPKKVNEKKYITIE